MKKVLGRSLGKRELSELFEHGQNFVKNLSDSDKILIIHHRDCDGFCSAAVFMSALERLGIHNIETADVIIGDFEKFVEARKIRTFNKIIILDVDISHTKKQLVGLGTETLIIDHHMIKRDLNSKKIIYINPMFSGDRIYQPVSYVVYKFLSDIVDLKDKEWVAVLGTIADYGFDDCKDLLKKWIKAESKDDIPKTKFWQISKMLNNAILSMPMDTKRPLKPNDILKILNGSKNLKEFESNYKIRDVDRIVEKVYEKTKKEFWQNAETSDDVIISFIRPVIARIGSPIITAVSIENKNKVIFLLEKRGHGFKVHARCQDGHVHLGKIMKKCCGGGGHMRAAGGFINTSDLKDFKKCVIRESSGSHRK